MNLKRLRRNSWFLLKETFLSFMNDRGGKLSAALAYYTIFSMAPLLLIIISLSSYFFGAKAASGKIYGQINGLVGNDAALQIQEMVKNVSLSHKGSLATIIGIVILVVGASGVFAEIQDSLNFIWGLKVKTKQGFVRFLKNRIISFLMIGSMGLLLAVALIVNTLMEVLSGKLIIFLSGSTVRTFNALNIPVLFSILTLLFTAIFKGLPDGKIAWKDTLIGAVFCSSLFMLGKFAIGAYLGRSAITSVYGAAGSVILVLLWIYYSSIILYFGAEFTKVYALAFGKKIIPREYAVYTEEKSYDIKASTRSSHKS